MKVFSIITVVLCSISCFVFGQSVRPAEGQHNFDYYTVEDGLIQSAIECMYQDSKGYIWFGTHGGVSRFDGKNFKNFTDSAGLFNYRILSIAEDHQGNMWFGTTNGLCKYDGKDYTIFTTANGLPYNFIPSLLVDKEGNLWVGPSKLNLGKESDSQPIKKQKKTFKNYILSDNPKKNVIGAMMQDSKGNIWFGHWSGGIYKYDPKGTTGDTIVKVSSASASHYIIEDNEGNIWFASWGSKLIKFDPDGQAGKKFTSFANFFETPVNGLAKDNYGNIWIATFERGIFKYDGKVFTNFTTKQGLTINSTWSILHDREGNIWIGTFGSGICKYNGERFTYYNEEVGLVNNMINGIIEDRNGNSWFATEGGVSKYNPNALSSDNNGFTNFTEIDGMPLDRINSIVEDKNGDVWIAHDMVRRKGRNIKFHKNELVRTPFMIPNAFDVYEDHSGTLWYGTNGSGARRYNGNTYTDFKLKDGNKNRIMCVFEDKKHIMWFGTYGGGVNVYDGKTYKNISKKEGFTGKMVFTIAEDPRGNLWFGSDGDGIYKCSYLNEKLKIIDRFTTADKLSNNIVASLVFDDQGNLWAGTSNGLNKLDIDHYNNTGEKKFMYYGKKEGFRGVECIMHSVCKDKFGNLWFGTVKGAVKYNPNADRPNTIEPLTHITNLNLFSGEEDWHPYCDSINKKDGLPIKLVFPYDKNHLTFEFIGISFTSPEKVEYQWKLENFDKNWSPITKKHEVTYSNIPPGEYTFKVKAANNDGVWNKEPTTFSFVITPPFWQTWWFYTICFLFAVSSIVAFVKIRERNLKREKKILEEKVKQRTVVIEKQKEELAVKNKDITDSIRYASNIQKAILPPVDNIKKALPDSFILFKPKDIVSGDFYFYARVRKTIVLAACDCTGHGVPGAFMSMIGSRLLDEIVNDRSVTNAAEVLNQLRDGVIHAFGEAGATGEQKDGMDMALCTFQRDKDNGIVNLQYAGAYNPLYLIREGELQQIKADKQPIGFHFDKQTPFTNHEIQLQKGDTIYIFSDGYQDQFGGPRGKKFMSKRFRQLFLDIQEMSMEEQKEHLEQVLNEWKGNKEQVDDILVIGIRV